MYRHLLVPIDGSSLSGPLVEHAVALAKSLGARVSFFNARPDFGALGDGALLHAAEPEAFERGAAGQARGILAKAAAAARSVGVAHATLAEVSDRPYEAIVSAADAQGCDLIVMASHGRRGLKGALVGSVTQKVLQAATRPVLVCAVESNLPQTDAQRALWVIREEHRSLAAVIHALQQLVLRIDSGQAIPNLPVLRAMLYYIEKFPERLHHPKEEAFIFTPLSARSSEHAELVNELEQQHHDGSAQFAELRTLLDDLAKGRPDAARDFAAAVGRFAESQWRHMAAEERVVLPAAEQVLSEAEWHAAAQAFLENGDPRFGDSADEAFADLFTRLLNLLPAADPMPARNRTEYPAEGEHKS